MSLSKPRPILKDMPYHIKKMIVESIPSYLHRLPLRKTSKEFIGIVDIAKFEMRLTIEDKTIKIESGAGNALIKEHPTITEAINHFKCFISKPNVTFFAMSITGDRAHSVELLEMLTATVQRPLRVKSFGMIIGGQAKILEFIEPGTLERVGLLSLDQDEAESIFRMEQWKQAQRVLMRGISAACEVWWDFPRFDIHTNQSINLTDLPRIREHISNSETFIGGSINYTGWTVQNVTDMLGGGRWIELSRDQSSWLGNAFPASGRDCHLYVQVFENEVVFRKIQL